MSSSKRELLTYGYLREYFRSISTALPPDDLITLFVSWIMLMDTFDKDKSDNMIVFESDTCLAKKSFPTFACAVGTMVVAKGDKQSWTCKITKESASIIVGIVDNKTVENNEYIGDHTDEGNDGYGIHLNPSFAKYHNVSQSMANEMSFDDHETSFSYGKQFNTFNGEYAFTMTLDMTQRNSDHGIFSFEFDSNIMKQEEDVKEVRTDGIYTTAAWSNIDIDRKYRVAFSIFNRKADATVELVEIA